MLSIPTPHAAAHAFAAHSSSKQRVWKRGVARAAAALLLVAALSCFMDLPRSYAQEGSRSEAAQAPNMLVFVADDLGWRDTGAYGSEVARTPNIDQLAREGLKVQRAFLTTSSCSPSRLSMLSSTYPHETGTEDLHATTLPDSVRILPSYLAEAGYYTGLIGKGHIGREASAQFDWTDREWRSTGVVDFRAFLDEAEGRPFFMWTGFIQPHRPFGELTIDAPALDRATDPAAVKVPPTLADRPATRKDRARYHDAIAQMDVQIGNYLDALEQRGLRENTLVVFVSDNGAPFPRGKGSVYDAGVRTPLIFQGPGVAEGATYDAGLVSMMDLAPTLLEAAGAERPAAMTGTSIAAIFRDQTAPGRDHVFSERNWHNTDAHIRSVRTERYRLVVNGYPDRRYPLLHANPSWYDLKRLQEEGALTPAQSRLFEVPRAGVELYDVREDPYQVRNLADEAAHAERADSLVKVLSAWRVQTGDHPPHLRRRPDTVDRVTGLFTRRDIPSFIEYTLEEGRRAPRRR